jgi:hypothetical protein
VKGTHRWRKDRLEYLRNELAKGRITQFELAELSELMRYAEAKKEMKEAFRAIDKKHGSGRKPFVQGGLPDTDRRRH